MDNYRKTLLNRFVAQEKEAHWAIDSFRVKTLQELLDRATANVIKQFKRAICVLLLTEEDHLVIKSIKGLDINTIEHRKIPIGKSFSGRLAKRGQPKLFSDVSKIINTIEDNLEPYYCGSLISTPLIFNKKVIGLLNVYRPNLPEPFSPDDFNVIVTYGRHTAFAIENQQLIDQRTEELRTAQENLAQLNQQLELDIEARKKVEKALRESEQRFKQVVESADEWIWEVDAQGKYTYSSPVVEKILGHSAEEVLGKYFYDFFLPEEREELKNAAFEVFARKETFQGFTNRNTHKDGHIVILETSGVPIVSSEDKLLGYRGVDRDITERKNAEQRQAQLLKQLENKNQELTDFAHVVSHDLKAPLRGIKTLANWLLTDYEDKLDEEGKEKINLLVARVDRMRNLIEDILNYSKVGRTQEERVVLNLNELVKGIIDLIAPPESMSVTIVNELPVVQCEKTPLTQVFQNLLSNAIKYIDKPQGKIEISCIEENEFWKFSVADNGPGIEEKDFERIFQMFQTLTAHDKYESSGIGLTLVKKIIELYGGSIWVESKVAQGTTFFFTLPKQEMKVESAIPEASPVC